MFITEDGNYCIFQMIDAVSHKGYSAKKTIVWQREEEKFRLPKAVN